MQFYSILHMLSHVYECRLGIVSYETRFRATGIHFHEFLFMRMRKNKPHMQGQVCVHLKGSRHTQKLVCGKKVLE